MNTTNHKPTKRRNLVDWMKSRQRRLFFKNKAMPDLALAARINQLGKQIADANS
jgi:hypothetical protein